MTLTNAEIPDKFHLFSEPVFGSKIAETVENFCYKFDHSDASEVQDFLDIILHKPEM